MTLVLGQVPSFTLIADGSGEEAVVAEEVAPEEAAPEEEGSSEGETPAAEEDGAAPEEEADAAVGDGSGEGANGSGEEAPQAEGSGAEATAEGGEGEANCEIVEDDASGDSIEALLALGTKKCKEPGGERSDTPNKALSHALHGSWKTMSKGRDMLNIFFHFFL